MLSDNIVTGIYFFLLLCFPKVKLELKWLRQTRNNFRNISFVLWSILNYKMCVLFSTYHLFTLFKILIFLFSLIKNYLQLSIASIMHGVKLVAFILKRKKIKFYDRLLNWIVTLIHNEINCIKVYRLIRIQDKLLFCLEKRV